jgi:hypothetical protein
LSLLEEKLKKKTNFVKSEKSFAIEKRKEKKRNRIMRTPHFGQDITNNQQNNRNSSGGGNGNDEDEQIRRQEQIISRLQENGATPVATIAGKGIIRVVSRCEDAKENSNLGELNDALSLNIVAQ